MQTLIGPAHCPISGLTPTVAQATFITWRTWIVAHWVLTQAIVGWTWHRRLTRARAFSPPTRPCPQRRHPAIQLLTRTPAVWLRLAQQLLKLPGQEHRNEPLCHNHARQSQRSRLQCPRAIPTIAKHTMKLPLVEVCDHQAHLCRTRRMTLRLAM